MGTQKSVEEMGLAQETGDDATNRLYALILAGGQGTRLWPKSRRRMPKQMLEIASENTMLQETFNRINPLIPAERIFVVTTETYAHLVREQVPVIPEGNVLVEPAGRGTAPCIGLSALYLKRLDPDSIMASLNADHVIRDAAGFRQALTAAAQVARRGHLVTLGIRPDWPHTGYGYIQQGELLETADGFPVYRVARFKEKPDLATAQQFLESGDHLWNSGIFVWKTSTILEAMERYLPDLSGQLRLMEGAIGTPEESRVLREAWEHVDTVSVDVGVLEKADDVAVIPIQVGWSDVGSWATLLEILPADSDGNVVVNGEHVGIDTKGSLVHGGKRLVATIGLQGMIIVDTDDVLLVCPRDRAQDVKAVLDELQRRGRDDYL